MGSTRPATSLRSTRSSANPNVTLYSLAETKPVTKSNDIEQSKSAICQPTREDTGTSQLSGQSRFFPESSAAATRSVTSSSTPRKRRKIEIRNGLESYNGEVKTEERSRSSSLSSLSPSMPQDTFDDDAIKVKLEAIATPDRRNSRRQAGTSKTPAAVDGFVRLIKEEALTPLKDIQSLKGKNGSAAKPRPSTPIKLKLDKAHAEPPKWKRQYELIAKMRERIVAPVDTM